MKKVCVWIGLCLLLCGCTADTFETLGPIAYESPQQPTMGTVQIDLPESAVAAAFADETETVYECDGYTLMVQTWSSGDVEGSIKALSGFSSEHLTLIESATQTGKRYEWVWTAAGEQGDVVCRAALLDDGNYHYCLCAIAPAKTVGAVQAEWTQVFHSFRIS